MILNARAMPGEPQKPWLIFLHGFSGDSREWLPVGERFTACSRLYIDLPGHGGSADSMVTSFELLNDALCDTLCSYNILNYWLIGYSLGGRVAMHFACSQPKGLLGVIVEGGHPGLTDTTARQERLISDRQWAQRFRAQPLVSVFNDWYQQQVFASLSDEQRQHLVALRSQNNGPALAAMLEATSLAVQPDLRAALRNAPFPFHYLCGEFDSKFRTLAAEVSANCHVIVDAGHNAHRERPDSVANCLAQILRLDIKGIL